MATENRNIPRITIECPMTYHNVDSPDIKKGTVLDISNSGILFMANEALTEGSLKEVHIEPTDSAIPAINAIIQIVRVEKAPNINQQYKIAGIIKVIK